MAEEKTFEDVLELLGITAERRAEREAALLEKAAARRAREGPATPERVAEKFCSGAAYTLQVVEEIAADLQEASRGMSAARAEYERLLQSKGQDAEATQAAWNTYQKERDSMEFLNTLLEMMQWLATLNTAGAKKLAEGAEDPEALQAQTAAVQEAEKKIDEIIGGFHRSTTVQPDLIRSPDNLFMKQLNGNCEDGIMLAKEILDRALKEVDFSLEKSKALFRIKFENTQLANDIPKPFYRDVYDCVYSIWCEYGKVVFTPQDIYRCMGRQHQVTAKAIAEINEALEYWWNMFLVVDATNELRKYDRIDEVEKFVLKGHALEMEGALVIMRNGQMQDGYRLLKEPLIGRYAQAQGMIKGFPTSRLQIYSKVTHGNRLAVPTGAGRDFIFQLNRRFEEIRYKAAEYPKTHRGTTLPAKFRTIVFDNFFEACRVTVSSRAQRGRYIEQVQTWLDNRVTEGKLKSYRTCKDGQKVVKVVLMF